MIEADFARRLVTRIDPDAARRRQQGARREGYVSFWQEDSGNAGLTAREMPAASALIAWQRVEQRALDLRAAGAAGNTGELHVQAVLDLLTGTPAPGPAPAGDPDPAYASTHEDGTGGDGGGTYPGTQPGRARWAAEPVLIMPWDPSLGTPAGPATVPGFGWRLHQPAPGLLVFTSPTGLTRTTTPATYHRH